MAGRNMNVYFQEKTYSKIKSLVSRREVSRFINEAVEEKLARKQEGLKQKLIIGYQERTKNSKLQKMLWAYGEVSWEDISAKLTGLEKKHGKK